MMWSILRMFCLDQGTKKRAKEAGEKQARKEIRVIFFPFWSLLWSPGGLWMGRTLDQALELIQASRTVASTQYCAAHTCPADSLFREWLKVSQAGSGTRCRKLFAEENTWPFFLTIFLPILWKQKSYCLNPSDQQCIQIEINLLFQFCIPLSSFGKFTLFIWHFSTDISRDIVSWAAAGLSSTATTLSSLFLWHFSIAPWGAGCLSIKPSLLASPATPSAPAPLRPLLLCLE